MKTEQPLLIQQSSSSGFYFHSYYSIDGIENEGCNLIVERKDDETILLNYVLELSACESLLVSTIPTQNKHSVSVFKFEIKNQTNTQFIFNRLNELLNQNGNKIQRVYCTDSQMILFQIAQSKLEGEWFNLWLMGKAAELSACIYSCIELENSQTENFSWLKDVERSKIIEARKILISQLHQPVPIKTLAKRVGINENYLKRGFKEIYGTSVYQYFQEERMKFAVQQLKQNQSSVSEVANRLGYSSVSHFSTAFKKVKGLLPCELIK